MSHFTTIKTTMRDRHELAAALRDLYPGDVVDEGDRITIHGYHGQTQIGEVAVRAVGSFRTDIGYQRAPDGTLTRIADSYTERRTEHVDTLARLPQRYAYHNTIAEARRLGFRVTDETTIAAPAAQPVGR